MKKPGISAFSLVELTLALGIAGFALVATSGLLSVGVRTNRYAASETSANSIIAAVVADLRATPKTLSTSSQFAITFDANARLYFDGNGQFTTSMDANSRYQLNVTWNGSSGLRYADLKVTWPAGATTANANGSAETLAAFDRN